jgi:hypothetical protein
MLNYCHLEYKYIIILMSYNDKPQEGAGIAQWYSAELRAG